MTTDLLPSTPSVSGESCKCSGLIKIPMLDYLDRVICRDLLRPNEPLGIMELSEQVIGLCNILHKPTETCQGFAVSLLDP